MVESETMEAIATVESLVNATLQLPPHHDIWEHDQPVILPATIDYISDLCETTVWSMLSDFFFFNIVGEHENIVTMSSSNFVFINITYNIQFQTSENGLTLKSVK
jgi:hypothetical protein